MILVFLLSPACSVDFQITTIFTWCDGQFSTSNKVSSTRDCSDIPPASLLFDQEDMKVVEFTRTCLPEDLKLIPKFNQTKGKSKTVIELLQNGLGMVQKIEAKVRGLLSPFQRAKPIINKRVFTPFVITTIVFITLVNFVTVVVRVETERKRLKATKNEKSDKEEG
jgi:hypothetical protein